MANQAVLEKVLADEEFVKGLAEMETPEEVRDALNAKGAEVTLVEVRQIAKSLSAQPEGELDEDALEDVAGGATVDQIRMLLARPGLSKEARWGLEDALHGLLS